MTTRDDALQVIHAPRLPRTCPVVVLHLRADNDVNGNPRRCFAVLTPRGYLVEVVDEGYGGEGTLRARWPWFSHTLAADLGIETAYAVPVDIAPAEYRRWMRRDRDDWDVVPVRLRSRANACEGYSRTVEAWHAIVRASAARDPDDRNAVVYHRTPSVGGDVVDADVRRNMRALVAAGAVVAVSISAHAGSYAIAE